MRLRIFAIWGFITCVIAAQPARLDHGRLDPAWFGPAVTFESSTRVYFLWARPGISLQGRSIRMGAWEPAAWLVKPRPEKDQAFLRRLEPIFIPTLREALSTELRGALPVSMEAGDAVLTGRVTDCRAGGVGGMFGGVAGVYFDLKLVDARSGDLLLGVHHFIEGDSAESIQTRYQAWCRTFAQVLAERALPALPPRAAPPLPLPGQVSSGPEAWASPAPKGRTEELETTLRRLAALKRDGLLTEAEFETLRRQAVERARDPE